MFYLITVRNSAIICDMFERQIQMSFLNEQEEGLRL